MDTDRDPRIFIDRREAGRLLGERLRAGGVPDPVVLGLTRGGVPVASEVARRLAAPLDVIVVGRLCVPWRPEVTLGALAEDGAWMIDHAIIEAALVNPGDVEAAQRHERGRLGERVARLRGGRAPLMLGGRTALIVDDGLATGTTARVACQVVRNRGAGRVVVAVPVACAAGVRALAPFADDIVTLQSRSDFLGVGQAYLEYALTDDDEVASLLRAAAGHEAPDELAGVPVSRHATDSAMSAEERVFQIGAVPLTGRMTVPGNARELVIMAHEGSRQRHSARSRYFSRVLTDAGFATLLLDLLTRDEEVHGNRYLAIPRLAERLHTVTRRFQADFDRIDYLGDGVAAAIALETAAATDLDIHAVACLGGRPDLVARLGAVRARVLLVVGEQDPAVLRLNVQAAQKLSCPFRLARIPGAGHRFREPGALQKVAEDVRTWFTAPGDPDHRRSGSGAAAAAAR
jgi:putative phosphoribosyl transferase